MASTPQPMSATGFKSYSWDDFDRGDVPAWTMYGFGVIGDVISITQVYRMRALWTTVGPGVYWYWEAEGAPDTDGSESGKPPAQLSDIIVIKHFQR